MIEETTTTTTKTTRPTASSATRELDDLMASLSNFKVSGSNVYLLVLFLFESILYNNGLEYPRIYLMDVFVLHQNYLLFKLY